MSKHKGRVAKLAKLTGAAGTVVVDVESGILVGVSNDVEPERTTSGGSLERRSRPPAGPNPKLPRN